MDFEEWMKLVVKGFEVAGVTILVAGSVAALVIAARALVQGRREGVFEHARLQVGRAILLGIEVLIIADIVQTITVEPTVEQALILGIIVLVRTFLSFSIDVELEGVVPWRRRAVTAQVTARAAPPPADRTHQADGDNVDPDTPADTGGSDHT